MLGNVYNILADGRGSIQVEICRQQVDSIPLFKTKFIFYKNDCKKKYKFCYYGLRYTTFVCTQVIATGSDCGNLYKINLYVVFKKNCNISSKIEKEAN